MLTVATQSSAPPYLAVTAGPASHSPPPMAGSAHDQAGADHRQDVSPCENRGVDQFARVPARHGLAAGVGGFERWPVCGRQWRCDGCHGEDEVTKVEAGSDL